MKIVKDGYFFIAPTLILSAVFLSLSGRHWIFCVLAVTGLIKAVFLVFFFRDPERVISVNPSNVLSPADGTVFEIVDNSNEKKVKIFLSIFNVHLQRSPVAGTIFKIERKKGKFYAANHPKAHTLNEQNIIHIKTVDNEIFKVHQIVGIIARRLTLRVNENQPVNQGDKIGLIKFGSQVDISMPKNYNVLVKPKDKVFGGLTILAKKQ